MARRSSQLLLLAGALGVAGVVLLLASSLDPTGVGWVAYTPESRTFSGTSTLLVTTGQLVGWALAWAASLLLVGVLVHRRARGAERP